MIRIPETIPEVPRLVDNNKMHSLRWNLLEPVNNIQVVGWDEDGNRFWSQLFASDGSPQHPYAQAPVTVVPRSKMVVADIEVYRNEWWEHGDMMPFRPEPLVIEQADGSAVTIGNFVKAWSEYVNQPEYRKLLFRFAMFRTGNFWFGGFDCDGPVLDQQHDQDLLFEVTAVEREEDLYFNQPWGEEILRGLTLPPRPASDEKAGQERWREINAGEPVDRFIIKLDGSVEEIKQPANGGNNANKEQGPSAPNIGGTGAQ